MRTAFTVIALLVPLLAQAEAEVALSDSGPTEAIQDRTYKLNNEIDVIAGVLPGDPYTKTFTVGLGYVFHFSDHFAWNVVHGAWAGNTTTGLRDQLTRDFGAPTSAFEQPSPLFNKNLVFLPVQLGSDLVFKPFYGKSSVVNRWVVHFDTQIFVGVNLWSFQIGGIAPAVNFGAGVRVFQNHYMSWRLDVSDDVVIFTKKAPLNVPTITLSLAFNFGATE